MRAVPFVALVSWAASSLSLLAAESYRYQFAPGPAAAGYTLVPADTAYSAERGYGFEPGAKLTTVDRGGRDPLHRGYCTGDKPFFFSIAVPPGNYRVIATLGDAQGESETTIKSELRRLMIENLATKSGEFAQAEFIVNVRMPNIAGGGKVKLKAPREITDEAWNWDERITLEFNGAKPRLCALEITPVQVPTVYILGDSTVCDQPHEPYASWGQMLPRFFRPTVAVANHAESGESLRSSQGAGRLNKVLGDLKPGDYVLIQYGHNDMKSTAEDAVQTYQATLRQWVTKIKDKQATPVLITSMHRHRFNGDKVTNSLGEYPNMVRAVAREEQVPLVDLHNLSQSLYEALGPQGSIRLFKRDRTDETKFDGTHHGPYGAYELAKCVIVGLQQAKAPLAEHVRPDFGTFDPAKPDPAASFRVPASPGVTHQRPLGD